MNNLEWLNSKTKEPKETKDYYRLYDDFCIEFESEVSMESFKRYCRDAFRLLTKDGSDESVVQSTTNKDGSLEVRLKTYDIRTEDDLIELSKLDPTIWECIRFDVKATQNGKNPYFITWGKFEKRIKDLKYPIIEKVVVNAPEYRGVALEPTDTAVVISDIHSPFQSEACVSIALQIMEEVNPKYVFLNGDILDCTDVSTKYVATIETRNRIQESLIFAAELIAKIKGILPKTKIVYLEGNHEIRLQKILLQNVSGAMGLKRVDDLNGYDALSIPNLLCLKESGVEWSPYDSEGIWVTPNLKIHHGEELNLKNITTRNPYSMIMGHGHRMELVSHTKNTINGTKQNYTLMNGHMADMAKGIPRVKQSTIEWQQGFSVVYFNEDSSQPVPVYVEDEKAIFQGKLYKY